MNTKVSAIATTCVPIETLATAPSDPQTMHTPVSQHTAQMRLGVVDSLSRMVRLLT